MGQNSTEQLDGKSILSLVKDPAKKMERGAIYWHYPHFSNQMSRPAGAMREGDWKLVENYENNSLELYHLQQDLSEGNDLAAKYPDIVKKCTRK